MSEIRYRCPDCGTENSIHEMDCEYDQLSSAGVSKAYIDIISVLSLEAGVRDSHDMEPGISFRKLASKVSENIEFGEWRSIHTDVLHDLKNQRHVAEDDEQGGIFLRKPEERDAEVIPQYDPMQTVYEHGPIDGCKDYCVFSMVSWCEMHDFDWDQTVEFVSEWLEETGGWAEQSWGESSIGELLRSKKHVHRKGLGWKRRAEHAKNIIDRSDHEARLDSSHKLQEYNDSNGETETTG